MKKDITIIFCPKCNWKIINPDEDRIKECPKCGSWNFEISQFYYYDKKNKFVGKEFGLTDNDEITFACDDWREAKRIIDKAFRLFIRLEEEKC